MILILGSVLLLSASGSFIIASGQVQVTNVKVLQGGDNGQCPSVEERERARNEIHQIAANSAISTTLALTTTVPSTASAATAISTTAAITTMSPTTGTYTHTYICNSTPGWRRIAFINMTDTSYNCPTGLELKSLSKRTCGRSIRRAGCSSTTFSVGGLPYSRVCGRIRAYQFGGAAAFYYYQVIGSDRFTGISLTHGGAGNRQHIWTYAVGISEVTTTLPSHGCPCDTALASVVPDFFGNDYFCESGLHSEFTRSYNGVFFPNDVLWDGQNCTSTSTCCQFNNPPWFTKNLPTATTNDIELRICSYSAPSSTDVLLEFIELYVQ